jgi:hypothetical protein
MGFLEDLDAVVFPDNHLEVVQEVVQRVTTDTFVKTVLGFSQKLDYTQELGQSCSAQADEQAATFAACLEAHRNDIRHCRTVFSLCGVKQASLDSGEIRAVHFGQQTAKALVENKTELASNLESAVAAKFGIAEVGEELRSKISSLQTSVLASVVNTQDTAGFSFVQSTRVTQEGGVLDQVMSVEDFRAEARSHFFASEQVQGAVAELSQTLIAPPVVHVSAELRDPYLVLVLFGLLGVAALAFFLRAMYRSTANRKKKPTDRQKQQQQQRNEQPKQQQEKQQQLPDNIDLRTLGDCQNICQNKADCIQQCMTAAARWRSST